MLIWMKRHSLVKKNGVGLAFDTEQIEQGARGGGVYNFISFLSPAEVANKRLASKTLQAIPTLSEICISKSLREARRTLK
jgi:hypothetical protein